MPTPTPTVPSPRTWATDDLITLPRLRADLENAVAFLGQKPLFAGQNNNAGLIANNTDVAMAMQVELTDNWNGHVTLNTNGAIPSQYWAPVPGWYLCRNRVAFATFASPAQAAIAAGFASTLGGTLGAAVRGPLTAVPASGALYAQCTDLIEQTGSGAPGGPGDYITPTAFQLTGANLNLATGAGQPAVSIRWVCATSGTEPLQVPPLTAVPSPITSAWMNANVRDAIRFLAYPPIARAHYTAGSSTLATSSFPAGSVVPLTTVDVDNYGGMTTGASAGYTAPVAGRYFVYGQFSLGSGSTTTAYCAGLSVAGGTTVWGDSVFNDNTAVAVAAGASVGRYLRLTAGQTVQLIACQGSGSAIAYNGSAANQSRLIVVWTGA